MVRSTPRVQPAAQLVHLGVRNLAVVEAADIDFQPGLNTITGETGAGKTVLTGALSLVLGGRADHSIVRDGARQTSVEALFSLSGPVAEAVNAQLAELDLPPCEEGALLLRRTVSATGGGRCIVNDATVSAATLRALGARLVDIHGPYDHQSLLSDAYQRAFLDAFGNCGKEVAACRQTWKDLQAKRAELAKIQGDSSDVSAEIDLLRYAVEEIAAAQLTEADGEELRARHDAAANAETILALGSELEAALSTGEGSAFNALAAAQRALGELARILPEAKEWLEETRRAAITVAELEKTIGERISALEVDPETLAELDARLTLVEKLKRKYGPTLEEVAATRARKEARLQDLETRGERAAALEGEIRQLEKDLAACGAALTRRRTPAAKKLASGITAELRDLGFPKAEFAVTLKPAAPGADGADEVEFGFAPNPGESMRPLKAIASSGEIARVALAAKAVLSEHDAIPVLVFDEIDSNIGGEVGTAVGQKLRRVAARHQTLCITHLPQSAVFGEHHFCVEKREVDGRTRTSVRELDESARIDEIARMLGGKRITSVVGKHARELLAQARR